MNVAKLFQPKVNQLVWPTLVELPAEDVAKNDDQDEMFMVNVNAVERQLYELSLKDVQLQLAA